MQYMTQVHFCSPRTAMQACGGKLIFRGTPLGKGGGPLRRRYLNNYPWEVHFVIEFCWMPQFLRHKTSILTRVVVGVVVCLNKKGITFFFLTNNYPNNYPCQNVVFTTNTCVASPVPKWLRTKMWRLTKLKRTTLDVIVSKQFVNKSGMSTQLLPSSLNVVKYYSEILNEPIWVVVWPAPLFNVGMWRPRVLHYLRL